MVVIVIHGSIGVVPVLHPFRPILRPIERGITPLRTAEHNEHLVIPGHLDTRGGGLAVDQDVAAIQALAEKLRRLGRERFDQCLKQANRGRAGHPPEPLRGIAVVVDPLFLGVLEGCAQALVQVLVEARAVDDVAELMNEDAFELHAAFVLHHIFLGEENGGTALVGGERPAIAPVVEVEFLAGFVRGVLRHLGDHFGLADEDTQHFLVADALRDQRLDPAHDLVEQIGGFEMDHVGDFFRSGDEDLLNQRALLVKGRVQLVFRRLFGSHGGDLKGGGGGTRRGGGEHPNDGQTQRGITD